jgi:hypothetical protein
MDLGRHPHLLWIAEEALLTDGLPKQWVERLDCDGQRFYKNKATKETTYENPVDATYRSL